MYMYVLHVRTGSRRHFNFVYRHKSIRLPWPEFAMSSSQIYSSQVTSKVKSQKLATQVRLESTINAVIEGIHVHRSVKLFLVLLRGLRGAPQSLSTARTPHAKPSLVSPQNPRGDSWGPVPSSQFTRGASFRTRGGLELLVVGAVPTLLGAQGMNQRINTCRKTDW